MGHSKSLRSYDDVREIFDQAVAQGGIRVTCKNAGHAVNTRARLNHFRTLDRDFMAQVYSDPNDPRHGVSPYDPFVVKLIDCTLVIEPREEGSYIIEPLNKEAQS